MKPKKITSLTFGVFLLVGCDKNNETSTDIPSDMESVQTRAKAQAEDRQKGDNQGQKKERIDRSQSAKALSKFASEWESVSGVASGQETLEKQRELALAVIPQLGGSDELLQFLDYLTERGAGDLRQQLIDGHLKNIFQGEGAEDARKWLITVEDEKLREHLSQMAGESFNGMGFKGYFEEMGEYGDHHSQAALLKGYCMTMAKTNPEGAIKVYKDLGYPKRIDNTGMAAVYAAMPPTTDFLKFATEIAVDSMTLAKRCRSALLENWSGVNPKDAALYVISNTNSGVAPDQLGVVVETWSKKSPSEAAAWVNALSQSPLKDEGTVALSQHWITENPVKAWEFVGKVGDFQKRVDTATKVFNEWSKTDRDAAMNAWVTLFPQK